MIQLEGPHIKIRKIISSRSQLPQDFVYGDVITQSGGAVGDEIFENGLKVENLPRQFDYQPSIQKINQLISSENVRAFMDQRNFQIDDSLTILDQPNHT